MRIKTSEMHQKVGAVLDSYQRDKGLLISILQDIQKEYNYLPREALEYVCLEMCIPLSQIYSVATFFKAFSLKPRGRHIISVCLGTACYVRGAAKVLESIESELKVSPGETTDDGRFTLETVNCVGACALGPMVIIDEEYHGEMKTDKVSSLLEKYS
ncbi:MAG: NADH-quinone oxidoreductase subunit NuoE [Dehalococcoidia bacterium]|nr:NADH-quinone oxidoreductase subunit NuoE [Dehalococcoidia bacterium]